MTLPPMATATTRGLGPDAERAEDVGGAALGEEEVGGGCVTLREGHAALKGVTQGEHSLSLKVPSHRDRRGRS